MSQSWDCPDIFGDRGRGALLSRVLLHGCVECSLTVLVVWDPLSPESCGVSVACRPSSFRWDVVTLMSVWFRSQRPLEAVEVVVELMVDQVLRQVFGSTGVLAEGIVCCRASFADSHQRQHGIDDLEGFQWWVQCCSILQDGCRVGSGFGQNRQRWAVPVISMICCSQLVGCVFLPLLLHVCQRSVATRLQVEDLGWAGGLILVCRRVLWLVKFHSAGKGCFYELTGLLQPCRCRVFWSLGPRCPGGFVWLSWLPLLLCRYFEGSKQRRVDSGCSIVEGSCDNRMSRRVVRRLTLVLVGPWRWRSTWVRLSLLNWRLRTLRWILLSSRSKRRCKWGMKIPIIWISLSQLAQRGIQVELLQWAPLSTRMEPVHCVVDIGLVGGIR